MCIKFGSDKMDRTMEEESMKTVVKGEYIKREVKVFGSGSHVILPKKWVDAEVFVVRKSKEVKITVEEEE